MPVIFPVTREFVLTLTTERPNFGETQIRNLDDLKPDLIVTKMPIGTRYKVLTTRHSKHNDQGRTVYVLNLSTKQPETLWLDDCGVISYKNGKWHCVHWLSREQN